MRKSRAVAASVLLAVAAVNILAACTPEDDSDVFETPPPAEPTPEPPSFHCQVVFTSQNADDPELIDVFVVDAPETAWIGGEAEFGGDFIAFYQPALDIAGKRVDMTLDETGGVVTSTADTFNVTLTFNGTTDGADVEIDDATSNVVYAVGTDGLPTETVLSTNNSFSFTGVWSSRDADAPADLGSGTADLLLMVGTASVPVTIGDFGSFASCYDITAEAQAAPLIRNIQRIE